jgi:predicted enzyme involved in methoxymalonyl-ACP biosynthesis
LILPEDEDSFEGFLNHIWAFDYFRITEEDTQRNQLYKVEKQRQEEQENMARPKTFYNH